MHLKRINAGMWVWLTSQMAKILLLDFIITYCDPNKVENRMKLCIYSYCTYMHIHVLVLHVP